MPRIPQYVSEVRPQGMLGSRQATGEDFNTGAGLSVLGQATQGAATVLQNLNERIQAQQEQDELSQAHQVIARKRREWTEQYLDRETKADPHDKTFASKLVEDIQTDLNKNAEAFQTRKGQQKFAELTENMLGAFSEKALVTQVALAAKKAKLDFDSELADNERTVSIDAGQLPLILETTKADLSADGEKYRSLTQLDRDALQKLVEPKLIVAAISGLRVRDPVAALKLFQSLSDRLDPGIRYQLSEKLFSDAVPALAADVALKGKFTTVVDSEATAKMLIGQGERLGLTVSATVASAENKLAYLPADQQLKVMMAAHTMQNQDRTQEAALLRDQLNNAAAVYSAGGVPDVVPDPETVRRVLGPVVGNIALRDLDERRRFGEQAKRAKSMSEQEMGEAITQDTSRTGRDLRGTAIPHASGRANQLEANISELRAEIARTNNPSTLALLNKELADNVDLLAKERVRPQTAASLQANEQLAAVFRRTIEARNLDPAFATLESNAVVRTKLEAAFNPQEKDMRAIAAARDQYVLATLAEQERLGVTMPRVLTNQMVNQFRAGLNPPAEDLEKAPDAVYNFLTGEQQRWDKQWPRVYRELVQAKAIDGIQMVVARLDRPDQATVAQQILRAHAIGNAAMIKQLNQPDDFANQLGAMVSKEMEPLRPPMVKNPGGDEQFAAHAGAAYTLSLFYMSHAGDNAKTAAQKAVADVIRNDYTVTKDYLVPKRFDASAIEFGGYLVKRNIDVYRLVPFESLRGLRANDRDKAMLDSARNKSVWANNKDTTGLVLTVPNLKGGYDVVEMIGGDDKRRAIEFTWDELLDMPAKFGAIYTPGFTTLPGGAATGGPAPYQRNRGAR